MSDGTGMTPPPAAGSASGAVTSQEVGRKKPTQGKFKSGIRQPVKVDKNKHGIRRETSLVQRKTKPKKV